MQFKSRAFWSRFRDAYGEADEVADLMIAVNDGCFDEQVAEDLWSRLCHQLTIYSASFPAVVALARVLGNAEVEARTTLLPLAGGIEMVRCWRRQPVVGVDEDEYRMAIQAAGKLALETVEERSFALDSVDELTGLFATVAVSKGHWRLGSGIQLYEFEVICRECDHKFPNYGVLSPDESKS